MKEGRGWQGRGEERKREEGRGGSSFFAL